MCACVCVHACVCVRVRGVCLGWRGGFARREKKRTALRALPGGMEAGNDAHVALYN